MANIIFPMALLHGMRCAALANHSSVIHAIKGQGPCNGSFKQGLIMEKNREIDALLKNELTLALGCTEPACAALSGARLSDELGCIPEKVKVSVSRDMMKNAMGVSIPNSNLSGIAAAVALGCAAGESRRGLSVLASLDDGKREKASGISVDLDIAEHVPSLFIEVSAEAEGHSVTVAIEDEHDRFSRIIKDGQEVIGNESFFSECESSIESELLDSLTLTDVVEYAENLSEETKELLAAAYRTNLEISYAGLEEDWGLSVGKTMFSLVGKIESVDDAMRKGAALAASGSDARMSGSCRPVMINSGSGNQGITVTVPVALLAEYLKAGEPRLLSALAISELVGLILTNKKARLSALCGAFTASIGTAVSWTYLLGGSIEEMDAAINNMIANLTGIICDGAKKTCALKIYSSLIAASLAVHLALKGKSASRESGIVGSNSFESIRNLSTLSHEGMEETDKTILRIMIEKTK